MHRAISKYVTDQKSKAEKDTKVFWQGKRPATLREALEFVYPSNNRT